MNANQSADSLIGQLVDGRYRIRGRIARGGMATVYVATDLRLERRIALKVMHSHLSDDSVFQSRFIQEARAAARLADPNVVNVYDQGQDGELAYLVMEYLPGITLRELLRDQRRLTLTQTITIMDAVLAGLSAAHKAGIVHRDVKPENVLLAEDGRIKIGDFGLARATTANTATGQQLLGTIAYLAPELVTRGTADARSDIYALGIMLYEMLTGEQPFKGDQPMQIAFQHATEQVPRPSIRSSSVPEELDELVLWATERDPDDRPRDAAEMLDRLREIERELGIRPEKTTASSPGPLPFSESGEMTRILLPPGGATAAVTAQVDSVGSANAALLRSRADRRRRRGGSLLAIVLILALLAGGAGWWFGSGPGSLIAVPQVAGATYASAADQLKKAGLRAAQESEHSLDVAAGQVIRTSPAAGERVDRDSRVLVYVSLGPRSVELPALGEMSLVDAERLLGANSIEIEPSPPAEFFSETAEGLVIDAAIMPRDGGDPVACTSGCTVLQGSSAALRVSLGPLPPVRDRPFDEAERALRDAELEVVREEDFSDEIAEGRVIRMREREPEGLWQRGDTVTLVVSKGPELFEVPNVLGMTRDAAKKELRDEGFAFTYLAIWDAVVNGLTRITDQYPAPSAVCNEEKTHCAKDSTIVLVMTVTG